jgi:hypothetical protein
MATSGRYAEWEPFFASLARLRSSWPARGWSWDNRFNCVTSSFASEFEQKARACVNEVLPVEWTRVTLPNASGTVRELAERYGGLRTGQLLVHAHPVGAVIPFGLWWPWGDTETISFRLGLADVDAMREPYPRLRELFSVSL